jgi:hypothetical protein
MRAVVPALPSMTKPLPSFLSGVQIMAKPASTPYEVLGLGPAATEAEIKKVRVRTSGATTGSYCVEIVPASAFRPTGR